MKEISEEEQWEIFELLEGNLISTDENKLLQKTKRNPALNAYYLSLKNTYLEDEKHEYPHKNKLIKRKVIGITYLSFIQYAASIVAIIGLGYWAISIQKEEEIVFKKQRASSTSTEQKKSTYPLVQLSSNEIKYKKSDSKAPQKKLLNTIHSLNKFESKSFNPSTKLLEETEFFNQLVANQYLTSAEKKTKMLKWLILNTPNPQIQVANATELNQTVKVEYQVVQQDILSTPEIESQELNSIWVSEAKEMLKKGQIPKIKFTSSKSEKKWLPKFDLEIQTNTASMVKNIIE